MPPGPSFLPWQPAGAGAPGRLRSAAAGCPGVRSRTRARARRRQHSHPEELLHAHGGLVHEGDRLLPRGEHQGPLDEQVPDDAVVDEELVDHEAAIAAQAAPAASGRWHQAVGAKKPQRFGANDPMRALRPSGRPLAVRGHAAGARVRVEPQGDGDGARAAAMSPPALRTVETHDWARYEERCGDRQPHDRSTTDRQTSTSVRLYEDRGSSSSSSSSSSCVERAFPRGAPGSPTRALGCARAPSRRTRCPPSRGLRCFSSHAGCRRPCCAPVPSPHTTQGHHR